MVSHSPWLNFSELFKAAKSKKIIFWGRSSFIEKTIKTFKCNVAYIVDIAKDRQGPSAYLGYDVLTPTVLKRLKNRNRYYIIITATAFYEVIEQLERYSFKPGVNFCVSPLLQNFKIIDDILSHKQSLILSSSDAVRASKLEGGGIYLYDIPSCRIEKKLSGITRGFSRYKDNYFVVDALKGVRILDARFKELDFFELPKGSIPHGLVVDKYKKLIYVVLCKHDRIAVFDMKTFKMVNSISVSDKIGGVDEYYHHMNDICLDGDSLYISMFSKSGNVHRSCFDGAIVEYDLKKERVCGTVADNLWQPHTIRIVNNVLCYLDSMRGNLHITTHKIETHFNGFVRGLDYDGRYYYIGQSVHRYFDRMAGYTNNISMDCGFFIFDSFSKACKFFPTPKLRDINTLKLFKPFPGVI